MTLIASLQRILFLASCPILVVHTYMLLYRNKSTKKTALQYLLKKKKKYILS